MRVCIFNIHDHGKLPIVGFNNIGLHENEGGNVGFVSPTADMCLPRNCTKGLLIYTCSLIVLQTS